MNRYLIAALLPLLCGGAPLFAQDVAAPAPPPPANGAAIDEAPPLEVSTQADRPVRRSRRSHRPTREWVAVGSSVTIKEGEEFSDVVVVHGNASIDGAVKGDLVAVLGNVRLGPKAVVSGDVTVVAGGLDADPASVIKGSPTVIGGNFFGLRHALDRHAWWIRWPGEWMQQGWAKFRPIPHQFAWSWGLVGTALLGCLLLTLVFPRAVQASAGMLQTSPLRSMAAGVLALLAIVPLTLLLLLTGIGVFLIPLVFAGTLVAFIFGEVAVFGCTGQRLGAMLGAGILQRPLLAVLVGGILFSVLYAVPFVGWVAWIAALTIGLGAVMLALFKREPRVPVPAVSGTAAGVPGVPASPAGSAALTAATMPRVGFWRRFLATLLDAALVGLVAVALLHLRKWFLLIWVVYHVAMWSWKGTTIGGIVVGLRIVRTDGQPINFAVALVRSLASFFSAAVLGLGFLWAGWSRDKQSWHDKIAGTIVVKPPRGTPLI